MRLRNHFSTNTDGGSEALPRSTRRSFLRYLGIWEPRARLWSQVRRHSLP